MRSNLGLIALVSIGLVIVTAGVVAAVTHALGMGWESAWVLGGAVAPTDAAAVAALARSLPRRVMTVLRAESLINDGTALVIYGLAVSIIVGQQRLGPVHVLWLFLLSYAGGAAAGLVTAWLSVLVRRMLDAPLLENVVSLMTPFTAFLLAELVHESGVLAVVVCGLMLSQIAPRIVRADTRVQSVAFWSLSTFVLNAALFVLVGLQLPTVASTRGSSTGCAPSTSNTWTCCAHTARSPTRTLVAALNWTSGRCASDCWPTDGSPPSGYATSSASTTPHCGRFRRGSTSKRSGSPAGTSPTDWCGGPCRGASRKPAFSVCPSASALVCGLMHGRTLPAMPRDVAIELLAGAEAIWIAITTPFAVLALKTFRARSRRP